jgi:hypothetical protein
MSFRTIATIRYVIIVAALYAATHFGFPGICAGSACITLMTPRNFE